MHHMRHRRCERLHCPCAGGILVCCGGDFSATFQACRFSQCTVYAVHGATATLRHCALSAGFPGAVAHGAGTALHLNACTLHSCSTNVTAECGATATVVHCRSTGCISSLTARGAGTAISCHDCDFSGVPGGPGVVVNGSSMLLRGCSVSKFEQGVIVEGHGSVVELHGCEVVAGSHPIISSAGVLVLLRQTRLRIPRRAGRLPAPSGPNICLACAESDDRNCRGGGFQLERCTLSAPEGDQGGVAMSACASAALLLCDVSSGGTGVSVGGRGRSATALYCSVKSLCGCAVYVAEPGCSVCVKGGRLEGGECAAGAENSGVLVMDDACASGLAGAPALCVVDVRPGGTAKLLRCTLRNAQSGVLTLRGAVHATDVAVSDLVNDAECRGEVHLCSKGFCQSGGTLTVTGGTVSGCAIAAYLADGTETPGAASFEGVTFAGNGCSLRVDDGADYAVSAVQCEFRGSASAGAARRVLAGVIPEQTAVLATHCLQAVSVQDSTFSGHQRDIVTDGCSIDVSGCTFLLGCGDGPALQLAGSGTLRGCSFDGAPAGISVCGARGRVRRVEVQRCGFRDAAEGFSVRDGAHATISACSFEGCKKAISAAQDTTVAVLDSKCTGADIGLAVCGAAAVRAQRLSLTACKEAVNVDAGRAERTVVTLTDCVATRVGFSALSTRSHRGVQVSLSGCTLEGAQMGLFINAGADVRVRDTRITGCRVGALAGTPEMLLENPCLVCGRYGPVAKAHAWEALHTAGPGGVEGAECVHEGAVVAVTLEDVVMSECVVGLQASGDSRVTARRLDVRGAEVAYSLTRIAAAHVFEDCNASGGSRSAVQVGRMLGPAEQYKDEMETCPGIHVRDGPPAPPNTLRQFRKDNPKHEHC